MASKTKHYHVTNEFMDMETGDKVPAGSIFEADDERAERLKAADVIGKEATKDEIDTANQSTDGDKDAGNS